jgi:hypothetical protein
MKNTIYILGVMMLAACGQNASTAPHEKQDSGTSKKPVISNPANKVPMYRDTVHTEPVAQFSERTENPLNDWYFSVRLYETKKTFHYLIRLQYEEIKGIDTLKLPNFGMPPNPIVKKGPEKYSCIIGFTDKEGAFREYKKIYVKGNHLKITAIKHYAVATYEQSGVDSLESGVNSK